MSSPVVLRRNPPTSPIVVAVAIVFTALAIVILLGALAVLAVYLYFQPKAPYLTVTTAQLTSLVYDQTGLLNVAMAVTVVAENDNLKTDAAFSELRLVLSFNNIDLAELHAGDFVVGRNGTWPLYYQVPSYGVPLDAPAMDAIDEGLKSQNLSFGLSGQAHTRWRVGPLVTINVWAHLSCQLKFQWPGGAVIGGLPCTSNSH